MRGMLPFAAGIASLLMFGGFGVAEASPMQLNIWGTVDGLNSQVSQTIDVSGGFTGFTQVGDLPGSWATTDGKISLYATLIGADGANLAWGSLSAPLVAPTDSAGNAVGLPAGTATLQGLWVRPGVDASQVPSWFLGLKATVTTQITGYSAPYNRETTLTLSASADPAVPEPGSMLVFAIVAGAGFATLRKRSGRASA